MKNSSDDNQTVILTPLRRSKEPQVVTKPEAPILTDEQIKAMKKSLLKGKNAVEKDIKDAGGLSSNKLPPLNNVKHQSTEEEERMKKTSVGKSSQSNRRRWEYEGKPMNQTELPYSKGLYTRSTTDDTASMSTDVSNSSIQSIKSVSSHTAKLRDVSLLNSNLSQYQVSSNETPVPPSQILNTSSKSLNARRG
ncbi:MAG: hypothetical protein AABY27_00410, partial [Pseudomonadota bacterium]